MLKYCKRHITPFSYPIISWEKRLTNVNVNKPVIGCNYQTKDLKKKNYQTNSSIETNRNAYHWYWPMPNFSWFISPIVGHIVF